MSLALVQRTDTTLSPYERLELPTGRPSIRAIPVSGVIANQPRYLGGVWDAESSQKGARFVSRCDSFGIPLLVLVDTPGYMPGTRQESAGVIRFGSLLGGAAG